MAGKQVQIYSPLNNLVHPETEASVVLIDDIGDYYTGTTVEEVLADIGLNYAKKFSPDFSGYPTINGNLIVTSTNGAIDYYVSPAGSDSNNGSSDSPFLTIGYAISQIPKILRHPVTINVAPGTYAEDIIIDGFTGVQKISLKGGANSTEALNYIVNRITLENNTVEVYIRGFKSISTSWHSFDANNCTKFSFYYCVTTAVTTVYNGFNISSSNGYIYDCVAGSKKYALKSFSNSNVFSYSWDSGSTGNEVGLYASEGGTIYNSGAQPSGTTNTAVAFGGIITGAVIDPAPSASPSLTGTPVAPTAAVGTNTTQLATTAFVNAEIANDAAPKVHTHAIADVTNLQTTLNGLQSTSEKGVANGYASLGGDGKVPSAQLPSFVDDVVEYAALANFPVAGETGKIYIALDTNKAYRWSGTVYIYITSGAVDTVAGKTGVVTLTKTDVGLSNVDNTADSTKSVASAATLTTGSTINGTSFNGSANITTANWGTSRTITIGSTGKAVNGSENVSWTLAEIGAQAAGSYAASTHSHIIGDVTGLQTALDGKLPLTGGTLTGTLLFGNASSPNTHTIQFGDNSGWNLRFMTNVAGTPTTRFTFADNGNFTAVGNVTAYSDERLKSNISTIPNALEKLMQLRGVEFDKDGKHNIGVVAQEVQKILPEVVLEAQDEMKTLSVAYGNMVGLLIEAIKEQQTQIEELKALVGV